MLETCKRLLATEFMPHGHCYFWKDEILWPIVIGDALTVLAYVLIPVILIRFVASRSDFKFNFVFLMFAAFILSCGFGHLVEILNVWQPHYVLSAGVKVLTGVVSMATVGLLAVIYPKAMAIPNVEQAQKTNQELRQSKEVLQMFIKHTPNAVAMFDNGLHYLLASDRWYTDYGIEGQEIIGKHHYDVFPEIRNMPEWQAYHQRVLKGEIIIEERDPFPRADGKTDWLRYELRPWHKADGTIGGMIMFTEVITERVELENHLIESEHNFRSIFETVDQGIVYLNNKGEIVMANPAAERMLGETTDKMRGGTAKDPRWAAIKEDGSVYAPENRPSNLALRTGKEVRDKLMGIPNPDTGITQWLRVSAFPIFEGQSDKPARVYATMDDITEEYTMRKVLQESEGRLRAIFESSSVGIALVNNDARPEIFNDRFAQIIGYPSDELKKLTFSQFTHPEHLEDDLILYHEMLAGKRDSYRLEKRYIRKDGTEVWADLSVSLIKDANGAPLYSLAMVQDISERKKAQEELASVNDRLELRVQERTAELAHANQELESFSSSISHDLKAPLRAINGFAHALEQDNADKLDAESQENLKVIRENAEQMSLLIEELLQFSKLGRRALAITEVDMNLLVKDALAVASAGVDSDRYTFNIKELPTVMADVVLLKQVMVNLLSNAIKYSSRSTTPTITIGVEQNQDETIFSVADNGVGFDMKHSDNLFKVFHRLHGQEEFEGVGIGLSTVQRIIGKHGGSVWAEAEVGKGATFFFSLKHSPLVNE